MILPTDHAGIAASSKSHCQGRTGLKFRRGDLQAFDVVAYLGHQRVAISLIQTTQHTFPTKGEASGWIVFAMFEQRIEGAAAFAVIALDVTELLVKSIQISGGKLAGFRHYVFPFIHRARIVRREGFQREFVFRKGATMVPEENRLRKAVIAFAYDFVTVIKCWAYPVEGAAHNDSRSGRAPHQGCKLRGVTRARISVQRQLIGGDARQILTFEI